MFQTGRRACFGIGPAVMTSTKNGMKHIVTTSPTVIIFTNKNPYALRTCVYCDTEACRRANRPRQKHARTDEYSSLQKISGPFRKHARIKEYSIDFVENTSLQNPYTPTHVRPAGVRFHSGLVEIKRVTDSLGTWIKHTWVARCDFTRNWPESA